MRINRKADDPHADDWELTVFFWKPVKNLIIESDVIINEPTHVF